jgi:hypothetical protein
MKSISVPILNIFYQINFLNILFIRNECWREAGRGREGRRGEERRDRWKFYKVHTGDITGHSAMSLLINDKTDFIKTKRMKG